MWSFGASPMVVMTPEQRAAFTHVNVLVSLSLGTYLRSRSFARLKNGIQVILHAVPVDIWAPATHCNKKQQLRLRST